VHRGGQLRPPWRATSTTRSCDEEACRAATRTFATETCARRPRTRFRPCRQWSTAGPMHAGTTRRNRRSRAPRCARYRNGRGDGIAHDAYGAEEEPASQSQDALKVMSPRNTHQVSPEGAINVQEVVAEPYLISRGRPPQKIGIKSRREACVTEVGRRRLHVLNAERSGALPLHFVAEAERGSQPAIVQQIVRWTE